MFLLLLLEIFPMTLSNFFKIYSKSLFSKFWCNFHKMFIKIFTDISVNLSKQIKNCTAISYNCSKVSHKIKIFLNFRHYFKFSPNFLEIFPKVFCKIFKTILHFPRQDISGKFLINFIKEISGQIFTSILWKLHEN